MAKALKNYEFPPSRRRKYPWDTWMDGQVWQLNRGDDFVVGFDQMRKNVYNAAWSRGLHVRTRREKDGLIVQAFNPKEKAGTKAAS